MSETCLYMPHPENTARGKFERIFRRLSYDLWRRELKRFGLHRRTGQRSTIVDVGCGPGFLLGCLEEWFPKADVVGVDADDRLLRIAGARCKTVRVLNGDACNLPIGNECADVLFALHVIEHLSSPAKFFAEAHRVLRPGGLLVIATPNAEGLGARLMGDRWRGFSDPTHVALNGSSFWRNLISDSGFTIYRDGTTGLSGIPWLNRMPLGLIHWVPTFIFGLYPWKFGEAYICTSTKKGV